MGVSLHFKYFSEIFSVLGKGGWSRLGRRREEGNRRKLKKIERIEQNLE